MNREKVEQLVKLSKRGKKIIIMGASGDGKSTLLNSIGCEQVAEILEIREAHGKGSLITTGVTITNNDCINKDEILILMKYADYIEIQNFDLESDILRQAVYGGVTDISKYQAQNKGKAIDLDKIKNEYENGIDRVINHNVNKANIKNNTSLAHKIDLLREQDSVVANDIINKIKDVVKEIDFEPVLNIYENCKNEVSSDEKKNGKKSTRIRKLFMADFIEFLQNNIESKQIYDKYIEICRELFEKIKENGMACLKKCGEDNFIQLTEELKKTWDCAVILNSNTPKDCVEQLLNSEDKSIEFLFSDLKLIYKADEEIIDNNIDSLEGLVVAKDEDNSVVNNNYYDTQGLFHNKEEKIDDALDRILDTISQQRTDTLVFVLSASENVNTKDSLEVLAKLVESTNKDLKVYVMLSKIDEQLSNINSSVSRKRRTKLNNIENNDYAQYKRIVESRIQEVKEAIQEGINSNSYKHKPQLMGIYPYGLYQNISGSSIDEFMEESGYSVQEAILNLLRNISEYEENDKIIINVCNDIDEIKVRINNEGQIEKQIENMFNNKAISGSLDNIRQNICELRTKKAMWQSAAAAIRKGLIGENHESNINLEIWRGRYNNINVTFPVKMSYLPIQNIDPSIFQNLLDNLFLDDNAEFPIEDKEIFNNLFEERIKSIFYMGKRFSGAVFKEYYNKSYSYLKVDILKDIENNMFDELFSKPVGNNDLSILAKVYLQTILNIANNILEEKSIYISKN